MLPRLGKIPCWGIETPNLEGFGGVRYTNQIYKFEPPNHSPTFPFERLLKLHETYYTPAKGASGQFCTQNLALLSRDKRQTLVFFSVLGHFWSPPANIENETHSDETRGIP